jgi:hypothetical protein
MAEQSIPDTVQVATNLHLISSAQTTRLWFRKSLEHTGRTEHRSLVPINRRVLIDDSRGREIVRIVQQTYLYFSTRYRQSLEDKETRNAYSRMTAPVVRH